MSLPNQPKITRFGADPLTDFELANKQYVDNNATGNTFARVVKKVDQAKTTDTVLALDDELFFSANANKIYSLYLALQVSGANPPAIKDIFQIPSGATGAWVENWGNGIVVSDIVTQQVQGVATAGRGQQYKFWAKIQTDVAGVIGLQWAQNSSSGTAITVLAGTLLVVYEETA